MQPEQSEDGDPLSGALSDFIGARPRLFGIAYRMLGSAADAEDIVQNVWMRWQGANRTAIRDATAFLVTTTTRLAINVAQSARSRRESYIGPWLPEPVETSTDPRLGAERGEALELAVLVLLEKLSPRERAAYILRDAFDYPYEEIAEILRLDEANVRKLVSRARAHVSENRRAPVPMGEQSRLLRAFIAAARNGDLSELESLLSPDVVSYSDGGGVVTAARIPVTGRAKVAKFVAKATSNLWQGVRLEWMEVNGQEAVAILHGDTLGGMATIGASAEGIDQIMWMMKPSKLSSISQFLRASREA